MLILIRDIGPHYKQILENVAVSNSREALESLEAEDRKGLEKEKANHLLREKIYGLYSKRRNELIEANPFTTPEPPGPGKPNVTPKTRKEHDAWKKTKDAADEIWRLWSNAKAKYFKPFYAQAKKEIRKENDLPDSHDPSDSVGWAPDWMNNNDDEEEISVEYFINEIKEI